MTAKIEFTEKKAGKSSSLYPCWQILFVAFPDPANDRVPLLLSGLNLPQR